MYEKEIHGIRTVIVKAPNLLTSYVGFSSFSGSFGETPKNAGVAHFLEHMFFKGTDNRDYRQISEDAAKIGAMQNAYTSNFDTCYHLTVPAVNTAAAIELLTDMMFHPTFPEEEIEKERGVIQEERKMYEDNHQAFFFEEAEEHLFNYEAGHRIIGTEETIDSLTRQDFVDYRNRMYNTTNTVFLVVTSLPVTKVQGMCRNYFKNHTLGSNEPVPIADQLLKNLKPADLNIQRANIQQCFLLGAFPSVSMHERDAVHQCMFSALGGGMHSKLFAEVREEAGLCYSISAFDYMSNHASGVSSVFTQIDDEDEDIAKEKIMDVINDVRTNGFDKDTFECAKYHMLGSFCRQIEGVRKLASAMAKSYLFDEDVNFQEKYEDMESLNLEAVNAYAKDFWHDKDIAWISMKS
jgi:predicted Zn-dependent peptidase